MTVFLLAAYRLLHRAPRMRARSAEEMERARAIVATNDRVEANLATLGDKRFMFANDGGEGFVMYGVQGTSWIAMGDPVTRSPAVAA